MLKLLKYLKKYWFFALLAPLFMIGEVAMDLNVTDKMGALIDTISGYDGTISNIDKLILNQGLMMLGFCIIGAICGILSGVFANLASFKFSNDLRQDLFAKIMSLDFEKTDDFQTASLVTRVTNDVTAVQQTIAMLIRMLIRSFGMFILGIVFTIKIAGEFIYVLAVCLPLELLVMIIFIKKAFPMFSIVQKKLDKVNTVVHENLTGARVVKAFSKEDYEYDRFVEANNSLTDTTLKVNKMMALIMPLFMLIVFVATIVIYTIGGFTQINAYLDLVAPHISVGDIQKVTTYIMMIMMSLMMLGMTFANMARAFASAKRINEVLDCEVMVKDGTFDGNTKDLGLVEFKDVSFAYPHASAEILKNINFKINKGESVAIVGATGSGKSTIVNLIPRFYDVTKGEILVDNVNLKDYSLEALRNKIAIVLQKSELFAMSIKDNVLWGKPDATLEEVKQSCEIAQASEFINSKSDGYDTMVEEKGTSLSGGQKQRLSIARAIVKKPEILIFDDSTSALDLVTEAKLYAALKENLKDTTKIVVAQRIATAKHCDKIIVLDNGEIVAFDTHEVLIKNCQVYQDIYNSQLKKEGEING